MSWLTDRGGLSEDELGLLQQLLAAWPESMNLETMDGYFCALIVGPDVVMPSEALEEVLGGAIGQAANSLEQVQELLSLVLRHWNAIACTLAQGDPYVPFLLEDDQGDIHGNDWADGFLRGTLGSEEAWSTLIEDEEQGGWMVPIFMLHHEHDEDPELRPPEITSERRMNVISTAGAGLVRMHQYFRSGKFRKTIGAEPGLGAAVGRNAPCPCGSGKRYKRCCGMVM